MSYLIQTAETNAFLQLVKFVADLLDEGQVSALCSCDERLERVRSSLVTQLFPCRAARHSQRLQDQNL